MTEKDQENQQDNTPKKIEVSIPDKVSISYNPKPLADIVNAINETNETQKQEEEINNGQNRRQADAQEKANRISNRLFWASVAMFAVTALIFWWTHLGVDAAIKAADAAEKSVKESKKQFDILNEPFLEVGDKPGLSNWKSVSKTEKIRPIVTISIYGIGKNHVTIDTCVYGFRYDTADAVNIFNERDTNIIIKTDPFVVTLEHMHDQKFYMTVPNSRSNIREMEKGITFFGVIFFRNQYQRRKFYVFSFIIDPTATANDSRQHPNWGQHPIKDWAFIINKNIYVDSLEKYEDKCKGFPRIDRSKKGE